MKRRRRFLDELRRQDTPDARAALSVLEHFDHLSDHPKDLDPHACSEHSQSGHQPRCALCRRRKEQTTRAMYDMVDPISAAVRKAALLYDARNRSRLER